MNNLNKTTCYLIGGAPRTGKTTYSIELARRHHTKSISTDAIAGIVMDIASKEQYPYLYYAREHADAESFYHQYDTPQKALEISLKAAVQLEEPIIVFLRRLLPDWETVILEGAAVTPALVLRLQDNFPEVIFDPIFMHDKTGGHIEENIYAKGLWRRHEHYSDEVKPKEIAYAHAYNEWIKREAESHGMKVLSR